MNWFDAHRQDARLLSSRGDDAMLGLVVLLITVVIIVAIIGLEYIACPVHGYLNFGAQRGYELFVPYSTFVPLQTF